MLRNGFPIRKTLRNGPHYPDLGAPNSWHSESGSHERWYACSSHPRGHNTKVCHTLLYLPVGEQKLELERILRAKAGTVFRCRWVVKILQEYVNTGSKDLVR